MSLQVARGTGTGIRAGPEGWLRNYQRYMLFPLETASCFFYIIIVGWKIQDFLNPHTENVRFHGKRIIAATTEGTAPAGCISGWRNIFLVAGMKNIDDCKSDVRLIPFDKAGAVKALQEIYNLDSAALTGASAGAICAVLTGCKVDMDHAFEVATR